MLPYGKTWCVVAMTTASKYFYNQVPLQIHWNPMLRLSKIPCTEGSGARTPKLAVGEFHDRQRVSKVGGIATVLFETCTQRFEKLVIMTSIRNFQYFQVNVSAILKQIWF